MNAQEYSVNFNVNVKDTDIKEATGVWQAYLQSNSKKYWKEDEVKTLENFNIQNMSGMLNPSLMEWRLNNRILSVSRIADTKYLLKSVFLNNNLEIFALTNVIVEKVNDEFKLSNFAFHYTKDWKTKVKGHFRYIYTPSFTLKKTEVRNAAKFYKKLCEVFNVKPELITYFITEDCDDIYTLLGYDFFIFKGTGTECGYFEEKNNFVFATKKGGTNHYHEITHFINKFYPGANELLLTGLSAYISGEKAHLGKPLEFHIKRVDHYLEANNELDLSNPFDFHFMDEQTTPHYVIGAILCDLIVEKNGKNGLLDVFQNYKSNEELPYYLNNVVLDKDQSLDAVLREKIHLFTKGGKFKNRLGF